MMYLCLWAHLAPLCPFLLLPINHSFWADSWGWQQPNVPAPPSDTAQAAQSSPALGAASRGDRWNTSVPSSRLLLGQEPTSTEKCPEQTPRSGLPLGWVTDWKRIGGKWLFPSLCFHSVSLGRAYMTRVVREHEWPCSAILQPQTSTQSVLTRNPKPEAQLITLHKSWIYSPYKKTHTSNFSI